MATKLKYRNTTIDDLPAVMPMYENARRFMAANGNPNQWIAGYPAVEHIRADIERDASYVGVTPDGEIAVVFSFIIGEDPTYTVIDGAWLNDEPYGTIHRIAVKSLCLHNILHKLRVCSVNDKSYPLSH